MASIRLLRRRIKSAKNIAQITKAMEMVAASKMKRAQAAAVSGKAYAQKIFDMVRELSTRADMTSHPLLNRPAKVTGRRLVIFVSTNKGLCGGLNTNLFRFLLKEIPDFSKNDFVVLGKKGAEFAARMGGNVVADFSETVPLVSAVPALTELAARDYVAGKYDGVDLVFSEFYSALRQQPRRKTVLPLTLEGVDTEKPTHLSEFLIEPSISEVFDELLPHYFENQIRDAVLQSEASEQSARMVAMRNATDNATSLIGEFTLMYNKARQEKITYELSDIVTARLAQE